MRGQGQKLGGPHVRGVAAKSSYPTSESRGIGGECQAVTAQEWPGEATPHPRSGAVARRSYPTSKEQWLHGLRRTERSCSMFKGRRGDFTQGKEHRLHFAGAAVK